MKRPDNLQVGDLFIVKDDCNFEEGEIIKLLEDDGSTCPVFIKQFETVEQVESEETTFWYVNFENLEPYIPDCSTISDSYPNPFSQLNLI